MVKFIRLGILITSAYRCYWFQIQLHVLVFLFFILHCFCLLSQEKVITKDTILTGIQKLIKKMKYKWVNDAIWQTGNIERFLYNTNFEWLYVDSLWDYEIKPRFSYGEVTQKQNDELVRGVVQEREQGLDLHLGLFSQRLFYSFGYGTLERSNLRKIDSRWLAGIGVGWHVLRTSDKKNRVNLTAALLREETDFVNPKQPDYQIFRASFRIKGFHELFDKHLRISYLSTYMPSIAFDKNKRLVANITIEVPINKNFQLRSAFDYTYEGIVPAIVKKVDTRTMIGFVITNL